MFGGFRSLSCVGEGVRRGLVVGVGVAPGSPCWHKGSGYLSMNHSIDPHSS